MGAESTETVTFTHREPKSIPPLATEKKQGTTTAPGAHELLTVSKDWPVGNRAVAPGPSTLKDRVTGPLTLEESRTLKLT